MKDENDVNATQITSRFVTWPQAVTSETFRPDECFFYCTQFSYVVSPPFFSITYISTPALYVLGDAENYKNQHGIRIFRN